MEIVTRDVQRWKYGVLREQCMERNMQSSGEWNWRSRAQITVKLFSQEVWGAQAGDTMIVLVPQRSNSRS